MDNIILYNNIKSDYKYKDESLDIYNYIDQNLLESIKKLTMNQISVNKKRVTVELDYSGDHENLCAICLLDMHRMPVKHIPCGHTFHLSCLNKLLNSNSSCNNKCPCCRKKIFESKMSDGSGENIISNYYLYYYGNNGTIQIPVTVSHENHRLTEENINNLLDNILQNALVYISQLRQGENFQIDVDVMENDAGEADEPDGANGDRDEEFLLGDLIYDL